MAVRLTARCYTNWTAGIFWKRFLLRRKGISFNHNKEKHLNDSWSLLATIFKLRWRKFLSLFQGFSLPKKNFDCLRNICFGLVTIMKIEFPTSEAAIDPIWNVIWTRTHSTQIKSLMFYQLSWPNSTRNFFLVRWQQRISLNKKNQIKI